MVGPKMIVPVNTNNTPTPSNELVAPAATATIAAMPKSTKPNPERARTFPGPAVSNAVARIAASGGTFPARRAGR